MSKQFGRRMRISASVFEGNYHYTHSTAAINRMLHRGPVCKHPRISLCSTIARYAAHLHDARTTALIQRIAW